MKFRFICDYKGWSKTGWRMPEGHARVESLPALIRLWFWNFIGCVEKG